ncbi:hypothetical protein J4450_04160 [Candidatus Micrarchaeota archaeon]|nr:hypothetical protein [Candidatus Micrarchaeota archaeon]
MADSYKVEIISTKEKNKLMFEIYKDNLYEKKANIHGTCVKLFTNNEEIKQMWDDNFKPISDDIRPHARVFAINDTSKKLRVLYDPTTKTVIIKNCDYYGWVKSIALGLVADFFEDFTSEHKRYSIHGSFVDSSGRGLGIIGPSGSGKTTLTYGLLLDDKNNFVTDDWFFVRLARNETLIFASEKNSYIRDDLAANWPQFKEKLVNMRKDTRGRAIVDVKWIFGSDRIRDESTLKAVVLLMREQGKDVIKKLSANEALNFMIKNDFCNPHQLVRTKKKVQERKEFFYELFSRAPVYLLNTIEKPHESLERLKKLINEGG